MFAADNVAVFYETDWTAFNWVLSWAAIAFAVVAVLTFQKLFESFGILALILPTLGVVFFGLLPGVMMRHFDEQRYTGWFTLGGLLLAAILLFWSQVYRDRLMYRIVYGANGVALGLAVLLGGLADWLNRTAAGFPTSVAGLIGIIVFGGFVAWAFVSDRS